MLEMMLTQMMVICEGWMEGGMDGWIMRVVLSIR